MLRKYLWDIKPLLKHSRSSFYTEGAFSSQTKYNTVLLLRVRHTD